jgi:hypothetical protein
VFDFI